MTAPGTQFGLSRIGQIAVPVRDVDRATAFYRDKLGMTFLFPAPNMAFFQCGDVRLLLGVPEEGAAHVRSSIIYYYVDDIEAAYATLQARGVEFTGAPQLVHRAPDYELWLAAFRDPDGNTLALMTHKQPDR
ncbi:MAG: VOC family protein [Gemmatimonadaceae bacterium]